MTDLSNLNMDMPLLFDTYGFVRLILMNALLGRCGHPLIPAKDTFYDLLQGASVQQSAVDFMYEWDSNMRDDTYSFFSNLGLGSLCCVPIFLPEELYECDLDMDCEKAERFVEEHTDKELAELYLGLSVPDISLLSGFLAFIKTFPDLQECDASYLHIISPLIGQYETQKGRFKKKEADEIDGLLRDFKEITTSFDASYGYEDAADSIFYMEDGIAHFLHFMGGCEWYNVFNSKWFITCILLSDKLQKLNKRYAFYQEVANERPV